MQYNSLPRRQTPLAKKPGKSTVIVYIVIAVCLIMAGLGTWFLLIKDSGEADKHTPAKQQSFDKTKHSLNNPASLWAVVNKQRPLDPIDYVPASLVTPDLPLKYEEGSMESQLRSQTAKALEGMFAAAKADKVELIFVSGYRSHSYQEYLFNYFVGLQGEAVALKQSAKPGHSEHQTGLAADVGALNRECEIEICFGDMAEGKWVADNAHRFGFIIRYPEGKTSVTGFDYEPWHLRFVGKDLAAEMRRTNTQTLEEFFGLPKAPDY